MGHRKDDDVHSSRSTITATPKLSCIGSSVIPIINKLQDIFATFGGDEKLLEKIRLPQVAVIGSQSSGKSSVLEAIVGRDFLPRGRDICTRRPLLLQLEHCRSNDVREWGEFGHLPGNRFYDFSKIRREIQSETERVAGHSKGVSDKHIRLKISSPNVLNITLVDLPGITKVPVGDQPSDIEARIRKIIMSYIEQETCIILAVSPANSDLATSDALQMASVADPTGSRTIGVITKLDIMDKGTDACNFLLGKVIPLRLGYVGVVNRCQEDIDKNRGIAEALAYEEQFFYDHPVYNGLSDRCGIPKLAKKLNQILEQHITTVLPRLKSELHSQLDSVAKELHTYGEIMESKKEQGAVLLNIITKYCEALSAMVAGSSQEMLTKEVSGGARIHYIFQSIFVKRLEDVDPCEDLAEEDIRTAIQNATGIRNALFVPEAPFEVLTRRNISRLLEPSIQCVRYVYEELIKMSRACQGVDIRRFPNLKSRLDEVIGQFLRDAVKPAERMIENLIDIEMDYINSSHPKFIGGNKAVEMAMQQVRSSQGSQPKMHNENPIPAGNSTTRAWGIPSMFGTRGSSKESSSRGRFPSESMHEDGDMPSTIQLSEPPTILRPEETQKDHEAVEIIVTKLLLSSYYDIVRKNIEDLVPKTIMYFMVNRTKRDLLGTLVQNLYRENLFEELLNEQDELVVKRKQIRELFYVLRHAIQTLDEVVSDSSSRDSNSSADTNKDPRASITSLLKIGFC